MRWARSPSATTPTTSSTPTRSSSAGRNRPAISTSAAARSTPAASPKARGTANFTWTGGKLSVGSFGTSTIPFNLVNTGTGSLAPATSTGAVGTTAVSGNYTQGINASTALRIAGASPTNGNDQVNISGVATLAGTLSLSLTNGFTPSVGQNFLLATYGSRSGTYGFVAPPSLPQTVAFQLDYSSPTQLFARMVTPTSANFTSAATAATFGTAGN